MCVCVRACVRACVCVYALVSVCCACVFGGGGGGGRSRGWSSPQLTDQGCVDLHLLHTSFEYKHGRV